MNAYGLSAAFDDGRAIEVFVVFDGVAVLDNAFGAAEGGRSIVRGEGAGVDLDAHGA